MEIQKQWIKYFLAWACLFEVKHQMSFFASMYTIEYTDYVLLYN